VWLLEVALQSVAGTIPEDGGGRDSPPCPERPGSKVSRAEAKQPQHRENEKRREPAAADSVVESVVEHRSSSCRHPSISCGRILPSDLHKTLTGFSRAADTQLC